VNPGKARGGAQFPHSRLLTASDAQRKPQRLLRVTLPARSEEQFVPQPMQLRFEQTLHRRECLIE
jgi:hypothetical protein